ncbi:SOUL family heme-binding protein [Pseudidiomarina salilacus]|uniref:SOUL family heme-binding protein n=1 Tax=Pseudidiomarina salilacus TaxID=3384452 RepID=UPI00398514F5
MRTLLKALVFGFFGLGLVGGAMATEEPKYDVQKQDGDFELRQYAPMIVAEVTVRGSMDNASGKAFRVLADYIFGNNRVPGGTNTEIAMTTPVTMTPQAEKIAMTSPVTMQANDGAWQMNFMMPSQYSMETLPQPNNPNITIRELPSQHYAVIRFSGFAGEGKVAEKTAALRDWMTANEIKPSGEPELARYDPPWTLPFLRRNEVKIAYQP